MIDLEAIAARIPTATREQLREMRRQLALHRQTVRIALNKIDDRFDDEKRLAKLTPAERADRLERRRTAVERLFAPRPRT